MYNDLNWVELHTSNEVHKSNVHYYLHPGDVKCLICAIVANCSNEIFCVYCNGDLKAKQADADKGDSDAKESDEGNVDANEVFIIL